MPNTKIDWADKVWNPVVGCTPVSAGCANCYAKRIHDQRHKAFQNGKLRRVKQYRHPFTKIQLMPERLLDPHNVRKPTRFFVNSVSDLFHEDVPFDFIDQAFTVMKATPRHQYIILTKRPEIMGEYINARYAAFMPGSARIQVPHNIIMGVSVEDKESIHRIETLVSINGIRRCISFEPLIGPIGQVPTKYWDSIEWIVAGGESGIKARPMNPEWPIEIRDLCKQNNIKFFFKQWGRFKPVAPYNPGTVFDRRLGCHVIDYYGRTIAEPSKVCWTQYDYIMAPRAKDNSPAFLDDEIWNELPGMENHE